MKTNGKNLKWDKLSKKENSQSKQLGTKKDEIGTQGSSKGVVSPAKRYGKPEAGNTKDF